MKTYYVYIATNNIDRRMFEHKNKIRPKSFTAKYSINKLVYAESARYAYEAISREKQIKGLTRAKKIDLINSVNPDWNDLFDKNICE